MNQITTDVTVEFTTSFRQRLRLIWRCLFNSPICILLPASTVNLTNGVEKKNHVSLTTHNPQEPCIGHCIACGAFADWDKIITDLLEALEEWNPSGYGYSYPLELKEKLGRTRATIDKVRSLLPKEGREEG